MACCARFCFHYKSFIANARVPKHINELIYVDQSILHTNRRSNILSYLKIFDIVRKLFVESSMSQIRGYMNGHFSFTSDKGRCSYCKGLGFIEQDMQFLSDSIEEYFTP